MLRDLLCMPFDHRVDAEPRQWFAAPIEKDVLTRRAITDQGEQFIDCLRPQRTAAQLIALAMNLYDRAIAFGRASQFEIGDR